MAKLIAIANLKGGVGKSSITLEISNFLASINKTVIIVDCDIAQKTLYNSYLMTEDPNYDVMTFDPSSDESVWKKMIDEVENFDYVFFDIPGSIHQAGVLTLYQMLDKIIVLTKHSPMDLDSTATFVATLRKMQREFKVLFNSIKSYKDRDHRDLVEEINSNKAGLNCQILGVTPDELFKGYFWEEQAAIEKNNTVGFNHKKVIDRYKDLFIEIERYIQN